MALGRCAIRGTRTLPLAALSAGASLPVYSVSHQAPAVHVAKRKGSFGNLSSFSSIPLGESESSESSESDSSDSPEARRSFLDSYVVNVVSLPSLALPPARFPTLVFSRCRSAGKDEETVAHNHST